MTHLRPIQIPTHSPERSPTSTVDFHLRVFRATDAPARARAFQASHEAVLAEFGLTGAIDSCLRPWWDSPDSWMFLATDVATGRDVAGMRIDIVERAEDLPAFAGLRRQGLKMPEGFGDGRFGEACAWWVQAKYRKSLLPTQLMVLGLSSPILANLKALFGLSPEHTVGYVTQCGFRPVRSFGDDGRVIYPRPPYVSTLMMLSDLEGLSTVSFETRSLIESIRSSRDPQRVETQTKDRTKVFLFDLEPTGAAR